MAKGDVKVRFKAVNADRVKSATRGVTEELKRSERSQRRESKKTTADASRDEKKKARDASRAAKSAVQAVKDAERTKRAESRRTKREQEKNARSFVRSQRRAARQAKSAFGSIRGIVGALGAGIGGAQVASTLTQSLSGASQSINQRGGVRDLGQGIVGAAEFDNRLTVLGNQAFRDLGDDDRAAAMEAARDRILEVADATNTSPGQLLEGLETFQFTFANFDFGLESLESIARVAKSTGTSFGDLVGVLGEAQQQFGLTNDEADEFFAVLAEQSAQGAINAKEFAGAFSRVFGSFKALTGKGGIEGFREFGALAQVSRQAGGTPELVATSVDALIRALGDRSNQLKLAEGGVFVREFESDERRTNFERRDRRGRAREEDLPRGEFRGFGPITSDITASDDFTMLEDLAEAIPEVRGRRALVGLMEDVRRADGAGTPTDFARIAGVDIEAGRQQLDRGFAAVDATTLSGFEREGTRQETSARCLKCDPGFY